MDHVLEIFVYISVADNKQLGIFYLNIKNKNTLSVIHYYILYDYRYCYSNNLKVKYLVLRIFLKINNSISFDKSK